LIIFLYVILYYYVLQITRKNEGGFEMRDLKTYLSMVRRSSGSLDRNQSFIPGCIDIPLFLILVIGTAREGVTKIRDPIKYL